MVITEAGADAAVLAIAEVKIATCWRRYNGGGCRDTLLGKVIGSVMEEAGVWRWWVRSLGLEGVEPGRGEAERAVDEALVEGGWLLASVLR